MYLDFEQLREEYKIPSKELIDSCLAVLLQSENKEDKLTIAEQLAMGTLIRHKVLKVDDEKDESNR